MIKNRIATAARILMVTIAIAAVAFILPAAAPVHAAGPRNCVDITGHQAPHVACYEAVWMDGIEHKMTFYAQDTAFRGSVGLDRLVNFYVLAPQTAVAQGTLPFAHDHVVPAASPQNADYGVHLRGILVLCSGEGIATGACLPTLTTVEGFGTLPLANRVDGHVLTSVASIEAAAGVGSLALFDTGAVIIGTIGRGR